MRIWPLVHHHGGFQPTAYYLKCFVSLNLFTDYQSGYYVTACVCLITCMNGVHCGSGIAIKRIVLLYAFVVLFSYTNSLADTCYCTLNTVTTVFDQLIAVACILATPR